MNAIEYALRVIGWIYLIISMTMFIAIVVIGDNELLANMSRGIFRGFTLLGIAEVISRLGDIMESKKQ